MQTQNFLMDDSLQDLTKHHTIVMPVACYEKTIKNHLHGYIPLHWHDEIQFVLIIKGEALFQVNEEWVVVRQGDGLFINRPPKIPPNIEPNLAKVLVISI